MSPHLIACFDRAQVPLGSELVDATMGLTDPNGNPTALFKALRHIMQGHTSEAVIDDVSDRRRPCPQMVDFYTTIASVMHGQGSNRVRLLGCFRLLLQRMATQVKGNVLYIVLETIPVELNAPFVASCDLVLTPTGDNWAWLPDSMAVWRQWHETECQRQTTLPVGDDDAAFAFNPKFPLSILKKTH